RGWFEFEDRLDTDRIMRGHADEWRGVSSPQRHDMAQGCLDRQRTVFHVNPGEIKPSLREQLADRRVGERHRDANANFAALDFLFELFCVIEAHNDGFESALKR